MVTTQCENSLYPFFALAFLTHCFNISTGSHKDDLHMHKSFYIRQACNHHFESIKGHGNDPA